MPKIRIVSLVPSLTELVCALGLRPWLVGRTGFCIHPADLTEVPKVGGTKDVRLDRVRALAPTHVLVNVDENRRETAEELRTFVPNVVVTHPLGPDDNPPLYRLLGGIFGRDAEAERLCAAFGRRGLETVVIRPKTFIGPERLGVFEILFDWIREGRRIPILGSGANLYQLLAVEDLVDAVVASDSSAARASVRSGDRSTHPGRAALRATASNPVSTAGDGWLRSTNPRCSAASSGSCNATHWAGAPSRPARPASW